MDLDRIINTGSSDNKGQCVHPVRDSMGKSVLCGEVTLLDDHGNHYAFCTEHRKKVEARFREIWAKKKARMAAGRKKKVNKKNRMKINTLVMR